MNEVSVPFLHYFNNFAHTKIRSNESNFQVSVVEIIALS